MTIDKEAMWKLGDKIEDLVFAIQEEKRRIDKINRLAEEIIKDFRGLRNDTTGTD